MADDPETRIKVSAETMRLLAPDLDAMADAMAAADPSTLRPLSEFMGEVRREIAEGE